MRYQTVESLFITGTDTDVGKTCITAGLATLLHKQDIDVGVMKPFATGTNSSNPDLTDVNILIRAAHCNDPQSLINPQHYQLPASPYTAAKSSRVQPDMNLVISSFTQLCNRHDMILVEGIGGIMTPITRDYFVYNMIKQMGIRTVIVTRNRVGTINHTLLTVEMCRTHEIPICGIIINAIDSDGYEPKSLADDLRDITSLPILGTIPVIPKLDEATLYKIFQDSIDTSLL